MILIFDHTPTTRYDRLADVQRIDNWSEFEFHYTEDALLIILAELIWNTRQADEFFGFDVLRTLRLRYKCKNPVIILSAFSEELLKKLATKNRNEINVVLTPGHYFYTLMEFKALKFSEKIFQPINAYTLSDISNHLFSVAGQIDEEIHNLNNQLLFDYQHNKEQAIRENQSRIQQAVNNIKQFLDLPSPAIFKPLEDKILAATLAFKNGKTELEDLIGAMEVLGSESKALLPKLPVLENELTSGLNLQNCPWQILYLEDTKGNSDLLIQRFNKVKLRCTIINHPQKAIDLLKKDTANLFTVFICDYRLKDNNGRWYDLQGYSVLEQVFLELPNLVALFALTSFDRRTLLKIQEKHKMKVRTYSKVDVLASKGGFNVFCETVIEEGDKFYELSISKPKSASWNRGYLKKFDRPLKEYYRLHRMAADFAASNINISNLATDCFESIRRHKHDKRTFVEFNDLNIQEGIGIEKIQLSSAVKLEKFRNKLIGRRVAIALFQLLEMNKQQIYWAMKTGSYRKEVNENQNSVNQYFSTYMGLSLEKDIPDGLLPEERFWLEQLTKSFNIL